MISIYTNSQENSVKYEKQFAPFPGHLSGATFHLLLAHTAATQRLLLSSNTMSDKGRREEDRVSIPNKHAIL